MLIIDMFKVSDKWLFRTPFKRMVEIHLENTGGWCYITRDNVVNRGEEDEEFIGNILYLKPTTGREMPITITGRDQWMPFVYGEDGWEHVEERSLYGEYRAKTRPTKVPVESGVRETVLLAELMRARKFNLRVCSQLEDEML